MPFTPTLPANMARVIVSCVNAATAAAPRALSAAATAIDAASLPGGSTVVITFKVTNEGNRATRDDNWIDRVYLSLDASLDEGDWLMSRESAPGVIVRAENRHVGILGAGESYEATVTVTLPFELEGPMHVIAMTDAELNESGYAVSTLSPHS